MNAPSHEAVAQCASEIWQKQGRPEGRDTEIWLEAERQMAGVADEVAKIVSASVSATGPVDRSATEAKPGVPDKLSHPVTLIPGGAAAQVTQQKKLARAGKRPSKTAPHPVPAETGKPLWDRPHSS